MVKSKAIELLRILNSREFKKFGEFIISPIHNKNHRMIQLYETIKDYYPDFNNEYFTKEKLYAGVFAETDYKDNLMRKLLSEFSGKILEFLALINLKKDRLELNKHLISELNKRDSLKLFEESFKEAEDIFRYPLTSEELLNYKHTLEFEKNTLFLKKNKFSPGEGILNESDYLIKFFLVKILKRYTYILNIQIYELNTIYKYNFLDEILKHLEMNHYEDVPVISLYHNIIMMLLNENENAYLINVKKILSENENSFNSLDAYNTYFILSNYYRKKNDKGSSLYVNELFELYKRQLSKGVYKAENFIHPTLFLNIVRTAVRVKEFEWVENFIYEYIDEIELHYKENTRNFSLAIFYFFRKNYDDSLNYLNLLKFNGYYHKLDVYSYRLRIYYELNEIEPMMSLIDSYKHILSKRSVYS